MKVAYQIVAVIGSALMIIGVFAPILGVPIFHDQSLMSLRPNVAWTILGLAVLSILIAVFRRFKWLYVPAIIAVGLIAYTPVAMQARKDAIQSDIKENVASVPGGLAGKVVSGANLEHGWGLMMLGAVMVLAVPLLSSRLHRRERSAQNASGVKATASTTSGKS